MGKKIPIVLGHSDSSSYCAFMADTYPASEGGDSNFDASGVLTTQASRSRQAVSVCRDLRVAARWLGRS
jgi:hypothetical protein